MAILALLSITTQTSSAGEKRVPWTTSRVKGSPEKPSRYRLSRIFGGLNFTNPVDLAWEPSRNLWFVAEQGGKVFSFEGDDPRPALAADFGPLQGKDGSLYAITFDPGFATNNFIYVCYVLKSDLPDGSRISRFKVNSGSEPKLDMASEEILITWFSGGHNGCCLKFGKDGMLYISTGDGAGPNPPDPLRTGQDISDLLSSLLRIDVHHRDAGKNYAVPKDNPFISMEKARAEIWAYGFRNPWRFGIDEKSGDIWVADVGWELWELIYRVDRGGNYGWSIVEGRQSVLPDARRGPGPIIKPIKDHPHSEAASITGGFVYYGQKYPELRGAFIYGDWETGKIWGLQAQGTNITFLEELTDSTTRVVAFAPDPKGEIVVLDYQGGIYSLELNPAASQPADFPTKLSQTGLFRSLTNMELNPGVYPFQVTAPMWRDFAQAERVIGLPDDTAVNTTERPWKFPSNAVLALTFSMEMEHGKSESRKKIETQLLHNTGDGWGAYSYRWNDDQTDAELVPVSGADETLQVKDERQPGGIRRQPWRFHARAECLRCHNPWCGAALGFQAEQLTAVNEHWREDGFLTGRPKEKVKRLVNPHDSNAELPARARSYLHANCSHCHRENAGGSVPAVMNIDLPNDRMHMVDAAPTIGELGLDHAKVIASGRPFSSVALFRASATGRSRMPYLSSKLVDEKGVTLLREWIASLGPAESAREPVIPPATSSDALRLAHALQSMPGQQRLEIAEQAARTPNTLIRELFDRFLPADEQTTFQYSTLTKDQVLALHGDSARGVALIANEARLSCLQCHTFGDKGRQFGPNLNTALRGKTREQILESILEPSKQIAPEFTLYTADLTDDESISGIIIQKTEDRIILRDTTGADHPVPAAKVKSLRPQQLSAMPEGILSGLSAQEAADLLEALLQAKE